MKYIRFILPLLIIVSSCFLAEKRSEEIKEGEERGLKRIKEETCLKKIKADLIQRDDTILNLSRDVDCFDWDFLQVKRSGAFEKKEVENVRYEIVGDWYLDFLDKDRNWSYIYFYKDSTVLNYALAIHEKYLDLDSLAYTGEINKSKAVFYLYEYKERFYEKWQFYEDYEGRDTIFIRYALLGSESDTINVNKVN